jgi:hypothetical protein
MLVFLIVKNKQRGGISAQKKGYNVTSGAKPLYLNIIIFPTALSSIDI